MMVHYEVESRMLMASGWGKWVAESLSHFATPRLAEEHAEALQRRLRVPTDWEFRIVRVSREVAHYVAPLKALRG